MEGLFSSVGEETEKVLLSAWSHPLFSQLSDAEPQVQSDAPLAAASPAQLEVELVKVVVMSKGDRGEVCGNDDVGPTESAVGTETSNERPVVSEGDG